ncbi:MAG: VUT family protein [Candidatus Fimimonas sp.]
MKEKIKNEILEIKILLRSVPSALVTLFVLSVFAMNLLANKSLTLPFSWLALDCGIIVSWFAFLAMDIVTKHFGPKAATQLSAFAILANLLFCLFFFLGSKIDGIWGESFVEGSENAINNALNNTFGGTWYVLLGSTVAFGVSAVVNNFSNWGIGKAFKKRPDGAAAYFLRTYVSTALGQFVDNLVFALIVSHNFFGWTLLQCVTCAATGMIAELLFEIAFSYLGFAVCKKWKAENVGAQYFEFVEKRKSEKTA